MSTIITLCTVSPYRPKKGHEEILLTIGATKFLMIVAKENVFTTRLFTVDC